MEPTGVRAALAMTRRPRRQGQDQARQDEHRRASADSGPDGHPVDPGRGRFRRRQAGRRLHGRGSRRAQVKSFIEKLTKGVAGSPDVTEMLEEAAAALAEGDAATAVSIYAASAAGRQGERCRACRSCAMLCRDARDRAGQRQVLSMIPEAKRGEAAVAAVQAAIDLAEQAKSLGPVAELERQGSGRSARPSGAIRSRRRSQCQGTARRRRQSPDRNREARPQMGRRRRAQAAACSFSRRGAARTKPRWKAAGSCRRCCSPERMATSTRRMTA
jgi:hypothetical protein